MDPYKAAHEYIAKIVSVPGMKALLMDKETIGIISVAFSQTEMLQKEVFLFEQLSGGGTEREMMPHLTAVIFIRPTAENIDLLIGELRDPKFGEYHLFFSNVVNERDIERLAEADEQEVVKEVSEVFCDFFALGPSLFSLNIDSVMFRSPSSHQQMVTRTTEGLCGALLALRRNPTVRFSGSSKVAREVASEVKYRIAQDPSLFDFSRRGGAAPLLLILDRADDPVSPLLSQWTYQAMVHELLGIHNNRVTLEAKRKDLQEIVLSAARDSFFAENKLKNFGELGVSIKLLVDEFKKKTKSNEDIDSLEGIKKFLQDFPEFRKLSTNVSKHVTLMTELSRVVEERHLMELSPREQELACKFAMQEANKSVSEVLEAPGIRAIDKVKLCMLYALRYEGQKGNLIDEFILELQRQGIEDRSLVNAVIEFGGDQKRSGDLYKSIWGKEGISINNLRRKMSTAIKGVENIYTQHKPRIYDIIQSILNGRLSSDSFPTVQGMPLPEDTPPQQVLIFFVGGATYEEALVVEEFNRCVDQKTYPNLARASICLGGTTIHNSASFIAELRKLA